jgi:FMN reductase
VPGITVLVGNPRQNSRTLLIATTLAREIEAKSSLSFDSTIDLAGHVQDVFAWPNPVLDSAAIACASSDLLIVATPAYKASYTGLLKAFLDRYPHDGLAGTTAIPVMTTSSSEHTLAAEYTLRPLLIELGASVPTRAFTFSMPDLPRLRRKISAWSGENLASLLGKGSPSMRSMPRSA